MTLPGFPVILVDVGCSAAEKFICEQCSMHFQKNDFIENYFRTGFSQYRDGAQQAEPRESLTAGNLCKIFCRKIFTEHLKKMDDRKREFP